MKRPLTKGERIVAEMCGDLPIDGYPVLTEAHPFLRKVIAYMENRIDWLGTVTDLLAAVGDNYTPPTPPPSCCGNMITICSTSSIILMSPLPAPTASGSLTCENSDSIFLFNVTVL